MVLDEIVEKRKEAYKDIAKRYPLNGLTYRMGPYDRFIDLFREGFVYILKVQKNKNKVDDIANLSTIFENAGGDVVAIFTEPLYHNGSEEDLIKTKMCTSIPVVRLDIIFNEYQLHESKLLGADAVELIASILKLDELRRLISIANKMGLGYFVLCKNYQEINNAYNAGTKIIAVNSKTVKDIALEFVNQKRSEGKEMYLVYDCDTTARSLNDVKKLKKEGFDGITLGKYFTNSKNPSKLVKEIIEK